MTTSPPCVQATAWWPRESRAILGQKGHRPHLKCRIPATISMQPGIRWTPGASPNQQKGSLTAKRLHEEQTLTGGMPF